MSRSERPRGWSRAQPERPPLAVHTGAAVDPAPARLRAAAERILSDSTVWSADALNFEEVENRLNELMRALEEGESSLHPAQSAGERVLQQRLLDMLRWELLEEHASATDGATAPAILDTLRRLERIRRALDPQWHQLLPARLAGTDAFDLVVEVVHDLRSPLTSIMFLAETLRKGQSGEINDAQRKQLGIIYSAALGLTTVATDVIALARGADVAQEPTAPFSVSELFDSVRDMVRPLAEEKSLDLRFEPPADDGRIGNSVALGRVLLNLVTNALKFTEKGFIEVRAADRGGMRLAFSVRDTGRGMDDVRPENLFVPFQRTSYRHGLRFSGTGLGLSICRRTVEALGGELTFESMTGEGTTFAFELELPKASRF